MTNVPALWRPKELKFGPKDLVNIKALYAKDSTPEEFNRFVAQVEAKGLDPRLGHAYLLIYNAGKNSKKPRSAVTIISEGGYLAAADRIRSPNGDSLYLPDDRVPEFTYTEQTPLNPLGIHSCTVAVRKWAHGEWHRIPMEVFWDERAPIVDEWGGPSDNRQKTGKQILEPGNWVKMGRTMIAKCARVAACRIAFPDHMGGLYSEEERGAIAAGTLEVIDLTPDEIIQQEIQTDRMQAIGAHKAVPLIFDTAVENVPLGKVHDRIEAHFQANPAPEQIQAFVDQNRVGIKQYLAMEDTRSDWVNLRRKWMDPAAVALKKQAEEAQKSGEAQGGDQDSPPADGDRG